MNKKKRQEISDKFDGKCAYCGLALGKIFHIDHIAPLFRDHINKPKIAGEDNEQNMFPACPRCNLAKKTYSIDEFRAHIKYYDYQLYRDIPAYRMLKDFGVIQNIDKEITFYFEKEATNGSE